MYDKATDTFDNRRGKKATWPTQRSDRSMIDWRRLSSAVEARILWRPLHAMYEKQMYTVVICFTYSQLFLIEN